MATFLQNLETRRDKIAAELAAIEKSLPDYSLEGESWSLAANRTGLMEELKQINELIAQASGPVMEWITVR